MSPARKWENAWFVNIVFLANVWSDLIESHKCFFPWLNGSSMNLLPIMIIIRAYPESRAPMGCVYQGRYVRTHLYAAPRTGMFIFIIVIRDIIIGIILHNKFIRHRYDSVYGCIKIIIIIIIIIITIFKRIIISQWPSVASGLFIHLFLTPNLGHIMKCPPIISFLCVYIYIFMSCERKWSQYNKIQCHTSWWFQTFFIVLPLFGEIPILTNIFQMGWNYSFENLHVWSCLTWHPCSAEAFWLLGFAVVYMATVQQEAEQGADFGWWDSGRVWSILPWKRALALI